MHPVVANAYNQIAALCQRYGVARLEVFGSVLRDDFDTEHSDIDVVVQFDPKAPGSPLHRYFDFKEQLQLLLKRPVDLVELEAMQESRLKRIINRTKVPVYAAQA